MTRFLAELDVRRGSCVCAAFALLAAAAATAGPAVPAVAKAPSPAVAEPDKQPDSPRAPADPPKADSADESASAAALYRAGNAEYSLGHYREALDRFERAFRIKQVPAMLFNIAQCHRQLKQFEQASITYTAFLRLAPTSPQAGLARSLLEQVEQAVRAQESARRAPPTDASGEAPVPRILTKPLDPPPPAKPAQEPGPAQRSAATTEAKPPTAAPAVALSESATAHRAAEQEGRPVTWVAAGATVLALGAGSAFGLMSKSTSNKIASSQLQRSEVDSLRTDLRSQAQKANLLFAVGGGLALATGACFLMHF